ncbi:hypothetical protein KL944_003985 [Ogataea haglerorum]|nr:hypothetical protein KL944_003985 [Ogataea haglerorum]
MNFMYGVGVHKEEEGTDAERRAEEDRSGDGDDEVCDDGGSETAAVDGRDTAADGDDGGADHGGGVCGECVCEVDGPDGATKESVSVGAPDEVKADEGPGMLESETGESAEICGSDTDIDTEGQKSGIVRDNEVTSGSESEGLRGLAVGTVGNTGEISGRDREGNEEPSGKDNDGRISGTDMEGMRSGLEKDGRERSGECGEESVNEKDGKVEDSLW